MEVAFEVQTNNKIRKIMRVACRAKLTVVLNNKPKIMSGNIKIMNDFRIYFIQAPFFRRL